MPCRGSSTRTPCAPPGPAWRSSRAWKRSGRSCWTAFARALALSFFLRLPGLFEAGAAEPDLGQRAALRENPAAAVEAEELLPACHPDQPPVRVLTSSVRR